MKIIEAMKKIKYLRKKVDDLALKINQNAADYSHEKSTYGTEEDQREQIKMWIQSAEDVITEILSLRVSIQRTNLETDCTIEVGGKTVTKSIAEWIHRRRDLAGLNKSLWSSLNEGGRNQKHIAYKDTTGEEKVASLRLYFDPAERDAKKDIYTEEPSLIDGALEVKNAVTELI